MNKAQDNKTKLDKKSRMLRIRRTVRLVFVSVIVICAAAAAVNILCVVRTVRVVNSTRYTAADVLSYGGIDIGTPLLSVNGSRLTGRITSAYPYIKKISVSLDFPDSVTVSLIPTIPYMALKTEDGSYYYLDKDMKVLEKTSLLYEGTVLVTGMSFEKYSSSDGSVYEDPDIVPGSVMTPSENLEMEVVDGILDSLEACGLADMLTGIDLTVKYNLTIYLEDRITVELGTSEDMDRKTAMMKTILDRNAAAEKMIINVRDYKKGRCRVLDS